MGNTEGGRSIGSIILPVVAIAIVTAVAAELIQTYLFGHGNPMVSGGAAAGAATAGGVVLKSRAPAAK